MLSSKLFWKQSALVGVGAILGVFGRDLIMQIQLPLNFSGGSSITVINTVGAMVLGWLLARGPRLSGWEDYLRPFLTTGVLGGFTTTSAFALIALALSKYESWSHSVIYVLGSVLLAAAGFKVFYELGAKR